MCIKEQTEAGVSAPHACAITRSLAHPRTRDVLTVEVFLLGSADFMRGGFTHSLADGRASHAVLSRCDPIRDRLARHRFTIVHKISTKKPVLSRRGFNHTP